MFLSVTSFTIDCGPTPLVINRVFIFNTIIIISDLITRVDNIIIIRRNTLTWTAAAYPSSIPAVNLLFNHL